MKRGIVQRPTYNRLTQVSASIFDSFTDLVARKQDTWWIKSGWLKCWALIQWNQGTNLDAAIGGLAIVLKFGQFHSSSAACVLRSDTIDCWYFLCDVCACGGGEGPTQGNQQEGRT